MSIVQVLIGSIVSSGSGGGGGGGGGNVYPDPGGISYYTSYPGGMPSLGTAYDPGGAVDTISNVISGAWRRVTSEGFWSNPGSGLDDNPGVFNTTVSSVQDAYGGFGSAAGAENFAMEWYGYFLAPPGTYHNIVIQSDDVAMFWIGNAAISPNYINRHAGSNNSTDINPNSLLLTEGKWYPIRMRFQEWSGAEYCQVYLATEGGTAYAMNTYATASPTRLAWSSTIGNYASFNSEILHLGSETTNIYSGSGNWLDSSPALNHAVPVGTPTWLPNEFGGVWYLGGTTYFNIPSLPKYNDPQATISMWFNIPTDTTVSQTLISKELTFKIRVDPTGDLGIYAGNGYSPWIVNAPLGGVYTYGEWTNITVTISSANVVIYKNGAEIANTGGAGTSLAATGDFPFNIGGYSNGSDLMTGKVGEVKYYTGVRTAQQILDYYAATVNRYVTLTSGTSLGFNGTDNQYVVVADNLADWNLGNNWTIEWWQKIPVGVDGFLSVLCQDANVPTYSGIDVFINNGNIQMFNAGLQMSEAAATRGEWNHVAIQKDGFVVKGYINGVEQSVSGSHSGTIAPSSPLNLVIGSRTADGGATFYGQYFNGELANIRISDIARYTGTFAPPLTVVTDVNTKLSLDGSSGGDGMLIDELARHSITNVGAVEDTIS